MLWLQKNSFLAALTGITVLGLLGLFYYGNTGAAKYDASKEMYDLAISEAVAFENSKPYPVAENRDAKRKAIEDYRKEIEQLEAAFSAYRPGELKIVAPERFMDRLRKVNEETKEVAARNAMVVPDAYFCGFKDYTSKIPTRSSTGILGYQLEAIREVVLALAESGASELKNLHRPVLPEESGGSYKPDPSTVARPIPLEVTFRGPERALRHFVTSIANSKNHYWVIRSIRVGNLKKEPPRTSDAKFNLTQTPAPGAAAPANFNALFQFEEEGTKPAEKPAEGDDQVPAAAAEPKNPPAAAADNRILALVLGNEELSVHIRLDLMMFLEPKPLP